MVPAPNPFSNVPAIGAPENMPDCHPIEATVSLDTQSVPGATVRVITTAWEPSPEEIQALIEGGKVWLSLWAVQLPPACLTVGDRPPEFR